MDRNTYDYLHDKLIKLNFIYTNKDNPKPDPTKIYVAYPYDLYHKDNITIQLSSTNLNVFIDDELTIIDHIFNIDDRIYEVDNLLNRIKLNQRSETIKKILTTPKS